MNARIKELMLAAGFVERVTETPDGQLLHQPVFNAERFAELIIQECIDVHEDHYGIDIIGDVLNRHFGIKELK